MLCERRAILSAIETSVIVKRIARFLLGQEDIFEEESLSDIRDRATKLVNDGFRYSDND